MTNRLREAVPIKLRERAYASFTERLLSREIRAGQFVSQRELVEMTGVPLGAIRELIPRLEAEGLIRTIPQRGMQVAHVDLELIRSAFQFRLMLEREAARLYTRDATEAMIAGQREAHETVVRRAAEHGITDALLEDAQHVDLAFHEALIDHLSNDIVSKAYRVNWIKIRLIRQAETGLSAALLIPVMEQHLRIVSAIAARDADAAVEAVDAHISGSARRALGMG